MARKRHPLPTIPALWRRRERFMRAIGGELARFGRSVPLSAVGLRTARSCFDLTVGLFPAATGPGVAVMVYRCRRRHPLVSGRPDRVQDRHDPAVPLGGHVREVPTGGNLVAALDHPVAQFLAQFGRLGRVQGHFSAGPNPGQVGGHSALAASDMEGHALALNVYVAPGRSSARCRCPLASPRHSPPCAVPRQGPLAAAATKPRFPSSSPAVPCRRSCRIPPPFHRRRIGLLPADWKMLDQRQQIGRVEGMADDGAFRCRAVLLDIRVISPEVEEAMTQSFGATSPRRL